MPGVNDEVWDKVSARYNAKADAAYNLAITAGLPEAVARADADAQLRMLPQALLEARVLHTPKNFSYSSRAWREFRTRVLAKHPTCVRCELRRATHLDHVIPVNAGGAEYDEANTQALCLYCHGAKTAYCDGGFGNRMKSHRYPKLYAAQQRLCVKYQLDALHLGELLAAGFKFTVREKATRWYSQLQIVAVDGNGTLGPLIDIKPPRDHINVGRAIKKRNGKSNVKPATRKTAERLLQRIVWIAEAGRTDRKKF